MAISEDQRKFWDVLKYDYDRGEILRKNADILRHVIISKKLGRITEPLGECMIWIARRYAKRGQWHHFSYVDDMINEAIKQQMISVIRFNPAKSDNPFAFLVQVTNSAFLRVIHKEKRNDMTKENVAEQIEIGVWHDE